MQPFNILLSISLCIPFLLYGFRASVHVGTIFFAILIIIAYVLYLARSDKTCALHDGASAKDSLFKNARLILIAFGLYAISSIISLIHGFGFLDSWRFQESFLKFGIFGILLFLFFKLGFHIKANLLFGAFIIGGIINSAISIYMRIFGSDLDRISLFNGIFQFSYFSAVIGITCFNIFLYQKQNKILKIIALITTILCAIALFLGVSRGIILGFLVACFISFVIHWRFSGFRNAFFKSILVLLLCIIPLAFIPSFYKPFLKRTTEIQTETKGFSEKLDEKPKDVDHYGSIGLRFIIWDNAFAIFKLSPIFGMNVKLRKENADLITQNTHFKVLVKLIGEAHNEALNALAKNGIIGLSALIFMLASIGVIFARKLKKGQFLYPSCALSVLSLYIIDGIFNTPLDSKVEAPLFFICIICFLSLFYQSKKQDLKI
ncbi:MAG: O-antigen ligase family protein [Helicobacter sp.]|nr:O-antigen ligase family protein [Helicobacter sp.]